MMEVVKLPMAVAAFHTCWVLRTPEGEFVGPSSGMSWDKTRRFSMPCTSPLVSPSWDNKPVAPEGYKVIKITTFVEEDK